MSKARDTRTSRFTTVGKISKTRGTGGELYIAHPEAVAFDHLVGATVFLVPPSLRDVGRLVESVLDTGDGLSLKLAGIDSRSEAFDYVGRSVVVSSVDVAPAAAIIDEYIEVLGYTVREGDLHLGVVTAIIETAAHPIVVVEGPFGEVLIPAVPEFIEYLDDEERIIEVHTIPGMIPGREGEE